MENNEIFQKNIKLLKKKNEKLAEKIIEYDEDPGEVEITKAKDGSYAMSFCGKSLYGVYKPKDKAHKIISKLEIKKKDLVLIFGLGLGYYLKEVVDKVSEFTSVIVVEGSMEVLKKTFSVRDLSDLLKDKRVSILEISNVERISAAIGASLNVGFNPNIKTINYTPSYEKYTEEYVEIMKLVRQAVTGHRVNTNTLFAYTLRWWDNTFKNIEYLPESPGVLKLEGKLKGKPAIIVSAGPSLDKNIKYLHWAKGKALIIAAGSTISKLIAEGIKPDILVIVDGSEKNWELFRRTAYEDIDLVYEPMLHYKIMKYHRGNKIAFITQTELGIWYEKWIKRKGPVRSGGSVAVSCYGLAVLMQASPIIFMGQDLAFKGNQTHASGTIYENEEEAPEVEGTNTVENIYGSQVKSDYALTLFLKHFEQYIAFDNENIENYEIIDCTEGGAKIKGTKVMKFKDVYHKYIENQEVGGSYKVIKELFSKKEMEEEKEKMYDEIHKLYSRLKKTHEELKKSIGLFRNAMNDTSLKKLQQLSKIVKKIKEDGELYYLIQNVSKKPLMKAISEDDDELSDIEVLKNNQELYKSLKEGVEFLMEGIKNNHLLKMDK